MGSAVPLEKSVVEETPEISISKISQEEVYSPGKAGFLKRFLFKRLYAASQLAAESVIENIRNVREVSPDYEKLRAKYDFLVEPIAETLKYPLCCTTGATSFIGSFLSLRYSYENGGYSFDKRDKDLHGLDLVISNIKAYFRISEDKNLEDVKVGNAGLRVVG